MRRTTWPALLLVAAAVGAGARAAEDAPPDGAAGAAAATEGVAEAERGPPERPRGLYLGPLRVGGAVRVNYIVKSWDDAFDWPGELTLDTARVNLDLQTGKLGGSFEYRYYRDKFSGGHDYGVLHHAWLGWRFNARHAVEGGVMKVPFGILPYASHNWFFQLPYYVGFEDDYDLGVKWVGDLAPWNVQAAYYFRDEGNGIGDSDDSARYSYDLVREGTEGNVERDQLNVRVARRLEHADGFATEVGLSLMAGRVPNRNPLGGDGERHAFALHLNGDYARWNVMVQAVRYAFDVENDPNLDTSPDGLFVTKGAYDAAYHVAAEATLYTVGVAYRVPVPWKAIDALTCYDDVSLMNKDAAGYRDTVQNVLGCSVAAGMLLVYVDVATGRNQPWLGGDWVDGLAGGGPETGTNTRFNVNVGFYF